MFFIVYVSSAVDLYSQAELVELLEKSREKNARLGLTGMLLYKDGNFMQILEGEESTVRELFATISDDKRHRGILILVEGNREEREFSEWSMGFCNLNSPEVLAMPAYSEFLNTPLTSEEFSLNQSRCWSLLQMFKNNVR